MNEGLIYVLCQVGSISTIFPTRTSLRTLSL